MKDLQLTASCNPGPGRGPTPAAVLCGDYAVNTIQPTYQPYRPNTALSLRLPPQTGATIGDRLSAARVDWAWYSGGWSNANGDVNGPGWTNGTGTTCADTATIAGAVFPNCPNKLFQFHHQPFNYYANYAPGTAARAAHLRDEEEFLQLARSSSRTCNLKAVSFVKPVGAENEHPGYASESAGSSHLVELLEAIEESDCRKDTLVVVAYDEFGGTWDHVPPPGPRRSRERARCVGTGHPRAGAGRLAVPPGRIRRRPHAVRHDVDPGDHRAALQPGAVYDARCPGAGPVVGLRCKEPV